MRLLSSSAGPRAAAALALLLTGTTSACLRQAGIVPIGDGGGQNPGSPDAGPDRSGDMNFVFTVGEVGDAPPLPPGKPDCSAAAAQRGNAGCSFYAAEIADMGQEGCFAMFVVNPGRESVKLRLDRSGESFPLAQVARIPQGGGRNLTYAPFDEAAGLPPDQVAILFMSFGPGGTHCPEGIAPAVTNPVGTRYPQQAFHLVSDNPVVAYQIYPYGGAGSHITSSTMLLPEESWGTNYLAATPRVSQSFVAIIAAQNGTEVKFLESGGSNPSYARLNAGDVTTFWGPGMGRGLSGAIVNANKPVALIGGTPASYIPGYSESNVCCADSAHQQIPPLSAWGHEYVGVRHRSRQAYEEQGLWQLVGVVGGTSLSYSPSAPQGAPSSLAAGQVVEFLASEPFVVRSQDPAHPFYLGTFMTSANFMAPPQMSSDGDPEFVNVIPAEQYGSTYTFFTDPTYPETNLVVVRKRGENGQFADVTLDCAATVVSNWKPVGSYEFARVDLVTGDFQPVITGCDNGRHVMTSSAPFALTVWGWGTAGVKIGNEPTADTSYGYPAGAGLRPVNAVMPPLIP
jgi:hypothetical protein